MNSHTQLTTFNCRTSLLPAATALAALSGTGNLSAAIVHFTPTPGNSTINYLSGNHLYLDLDGGITEAAPSSGIPGVDLYFTWGGGIPQNTLLAGTPTDIFNTKPVVTIGSGAAKLGLGDLIDSASTFSITGELTREGSGDWFGGGNGFFGFEINANTTPLYGWIHLNYVATGVFGGDDTLTVVDWAYDDSGAGISAGVVPEPAESAAIAGAALLAGSSLMMRRRQKIAAKSA